MNSFLTTAFYHFITLKNIKSIQSIIQNYCDRTSIKGTILIANEGINGTISGEEKDILAFQDFIKYDQIFSEVFKNLKYKNSWSNKNPFYRMKVRLKKEIVALGIPEVSPNKKVGTYINPKEWNTLIDDPDIILLDTRNQYEVAIGTFKNAINPCTTSFREFPAYVKNNLNSKKKKKVAMFCTGGIRCEKASAFMLEEGFEEVYHLQGGILKYLETIPEKESLWKGECFVFDQRVAVTNELKEGKYNQCFACRHPLSPEEVQSDKYVEGISCSYCINKISKEKKKNLKERQKQIKLAKVRGDEHIGKIIKKN
ncbi:rhodanese-related sulfurtransferase [Methylophilaceae bacterium]|jgi:UPF0176 protein|nr:rhodanese-related sulfurtransferase [Methylophilaceae bacterium]|tara:strand:- start:2656 stop:3591 length:936 start_codon:yes stop_codon:yes gene_type:complete